MFTQPSWWSLVTKEEKRKHKHASPSPDCRWDPMSLLSSRYRSPFLGAGCKPLIIYSQTLIKQIQLMVDIKVLKASHPRHLWPVSTSSKRSPLPKVIIRMKRMARRLDKNADAEGHRKSQGRHGERSMEHPFVVSVYCRRYECVQPYLHSSIRLRLAMFNYAYI
jgi:hypothetical protein